MSRRRSISRTKGRAESGGFLKLPHAVMDSPNFRALSGSAVKLLCDVGRQYRGTNNGDLTAAWAVMQKRGWKSRDTLTRALSELVAHGLIEKTRQGGKNACNLFALTWQAVDECGGKLDVRETRVASSLWRQPPSVTVIGRKGCPESVSPLPGIRVNEREIA